MQEGHVSDKRVVDQDRSKAMMDEDKKVRIQKLTSLLESNIERYVDLKNTRLQVRNTAASAGNWKLN